MELTELLLKLVYYFPYYVALVLVPMIVRVILEYYIGVRPEHFERTWDLHTSYEQVFQTFVLTVLYFPLFEELVFSAIPLYLFGLTGLVIGSAVWVLMHPAWQLQHVSDLSLPRKLAFTATCTLYYSINSVFYAIIWLNGDGIIAIIYHMLHNAWLYLAVLAREIELPQIPIPRRNKYRYIKPIATEVPAKIQKTCYF
ncbi:MAG TPA: CPBP family intramembrane metalloprotease, partial [Pyrodictium sp.]|nr:CPBP family intramembrane metalloprotease [Pyrodictium sp.]